MGRRQHEYLETNAFLTREDDQMSSPDARLHQTVTQLSLVRARLLSTLDQLDALQQAHTASLAAAAREQRSLEAKLRAAEEAARAAEADRIDMRDAVGMLVMRVEATPDFRNWPRSGIHLSGLSEPSLLTPTPQRHKNKSPATLHTIDDHTDSKSPTIEQLAYASTLISHFRIERDAALLRAEHTDARVLELEARLARRDVELEACMCATKATKSLVPGKSFSWNERRDAAGHVAPPRNMRNEIRPPEVDPDPEMDDILDISLDRNRELEREVQELSRQLDRAQVSQAEHVRKATVLHYPHSHEGEYRRNLEQTTREASQTHLHRTSLRSRTPIPARPLQHQQEVADMSLLSSLSFSPSSTATSNAAAWTETGSVTPRQHEYQHQHQQRSDFPAVMYDGEYAAARSSSSYEDEVEDGDESVTQPVEVDEPIHNHDRDYGHGLELIHEYDTMKSVPAPIPSLHALHRQVALLGEKIDAFAAERRRTSVGPNTDSARHLRNEMEVESLGLVQEYHVDEERRTRSVPMKSRTNGGRNHATSGRRQNEDEDDGRNSNVNGRESDARRAIHVEAEKGPAHPSANIIAQNTNVDVSGIQADDEDDGGRYTRSPLFQPPLPPLPLPQSLSTPLPQPAPPPLRHAEVKEADYDHPHETCEATLLAARKREIELIARVHALESALAIVEAQLRRHVEMDVGRGMAPEGGANGVGNGSVSNVLERGGVNVHSAPTVQALPEQQDDTTVRWVDTAVQTLTTPPLRPSIIPAPVGDLLDLDVSELHIIVEKTSEEEDEREGEWQRESEEDEDINDGEMPMEIATPLSINVIPLVPDVDVDAAFEGDLDASAHSHGKERSEHAHGPASESGSSVEEELDARRDADDQPSPREVLGSPPFDEEPLAANMSLLLEPARVESRNNPPSHLSVRSTSSPPATHNSVSRHPVSPPARRDSPSQPSSTDTSPTIAVGLLPPVPLHAHLSLPVPLLHHSHHTSSSSSQLLPLLGPHLGLRRAHTDSDIGSNDHTQITGSAHRFALYRATSSFVAELRQVESQLTVNATRAEAQSLLAGDDDLVSPTLPNPEEGTVGPRTPDERLPLSPSEVPEYTIFY